MDEKHLLELIAGTLYSTKETQMNSYNLGKYVVENVIPYYEPLIQAQKRDRHLYWTNFTLPKTVSNRDISGIVSQAKNELQKLCEIDIMLKSYYSKIDIFSDFFKQ